MSYTFVPFPDDHIHTVPENTTLEAQIELERGKVEKAFKQRKTAAQQWTRVANRYADIIDDLLKGKLRYDQQALLIVAELDQQLEATWENLNVAQDALLAEASKVKYQEIQHAFEDWICHYVEKRAHASLSHPLEVKISLFQLVC